MKLLTEFTRIIVLLATSEIYGSFADGVLEFRVPEARPAQAVGHESEEVVP